MSQTGTPAFDPQQLDNLIYDPFEASNDMDEGELDSVDPDKNFLKMRRGTAIHNCKYYYSSNLMEKLQDNIENAEISIFHLNIRSTHKNLNTLIPTLHSSGTKFDILGFTETWLKSSNADCYGIHGYSHEFLTRGEKAGGGSPCT